MAKAKVINVDIRNDGSVIAYYDTGSTKAFKSVEATPKTVKTWLDANAPAPVTVQATETGIVLVAPAEVVETIMETAQEPAQLPVVAATSKRHTEPVDSWRDMEPNWLWMLPTVPLVFAWWGVIVALIGVRALGLVAEGVEKSVHLARGVVKFLRAWWKQSTGFRAELLREYRLSDWEVA